MNKLLFFTISLLIIGCTKDINISEFSDDFDFYERELRIEAILTPTDFMDSVVRVDKTILITDTTVYNGRDDNGNWRSFEDVNGNGVWDEGEWLNDDIGDADGNGRGNGKPDPGEPNVDELAEILPHVHDSTMVSVNLIDQSNGNIIAEFEWKTKAGINQHYGYQEGNPKFFGNPYYGAYKPKPQYAEIKIDVEKEYEFQITTKNNEIISGSTTAYKPAEIIDEGLAWDADTLVLNPDDKIVSFLTDEQVTLGSFTFFEIINYPEPGTLVYRYNTIFPPEESDIAGSSLLRLPKSAFPIGLSKLDLAVLDDDYSQYILSNLPLKDEALSNLRDQDGNVVLGIAGSASVTTIYVRNIL